jgi:hypothetical protein
LVLGEEKVVIQPDVEDALAAGYQPQLLQVPLVVADYCCRQTDGFLAVVSRDAVGDRQDAIHVTS